MASRLIAKGFDVLFEMHESSDVEPHRDAALLHDPEGVVWPACSLLVARFESLGDKAWLHKDAPARDYFGADYELREGMLTDVPPADLCQWHLVGSVKRIFYWREGAKYKVGVYEHTFGNRSLASLFRSGAATLYRRGTGAAAVYRLDMPSWCHLDDRGIVAP